MKIIYTNLSPITNAYTNFNHIFYLKKQNPQKVYLCIWDNFVFESEIFEKGMSAAQNSQEKLKENVAILEKLMTYLNIDYKVIFLSEAMNRLLRNPNHFKELQSILAHIKVEDLTKGTKIEYIPFSDISISKINYIVADHLIATYLPELFPEVCSSQPTYYLTSERFKVFQSTISHHLNMGFAKYSSPKCIFVTGVPVINHPVTKVIPSLEMSSESIKSIVRAHYEKTPSEKEVYDLSDLFLTTLPEISFKNTKVPKKEINTKLGKMKKDDFHEFVTSNLYDYFQSIHKIAAKIEIKDNKKSHYVSTYKDFSNKVKQLNDIKLKILKNCNGNNSSLDIAKATGLKLSTVSTYLSHLKNKKIVDNAKKPKRLIDSFVIDLEVLENA
jgi:hypothetical protein